MIAFIKVARNATLNRKTNIENEMKNYEKASYTEKISECMK